MLLRFGFDVGPQVIRFQQKRDVVGVLEVRFADDPRLAVRTALVVSWTEAVEAEHSQTAPREMVRGSAAEAADSQYDRVEYFRHVAPFVRSLKRS